jgi:glutaredoxin
MAKAFLAENNVQFEEVDVSLSQAAAQEMVKRSGQMGVPVIDIDGQLIVGFDKGRIKKLLGL